MRATNRPGLSCRGPAQAFTSSGGPVVGLIAITLAGCVGSGSDGGDVRDPPADGAPATPTSGPTDSDHTDADTVGTDTDTDSDGDTGGTGGCGADAVDPGGDAPPQVIDVLTVTVSTGSNANNGTADATLSLCLTADRCFALAPTTAPQTDEGETGVWMFEQVGLDRAAVDRVELRVTDGADQWRPSRLDLRFDGQPVYCAELDVPIGTDAGDVAVWTDPAGLHQDCVSAWDRTLTHGPMVGAVGPVHANVWARTDATRPVSVQVWPTSDPLAARVAAWAHPAASADFTATLAVDCLAPSTAYTYQVWVDAAPAGAPGTFTTAPPDGQPGAWSMAFGSCTPSLTSQHAFAAIAGEDVDWFAFVGDNHYANTTNLDALRWYYRMSLGQFDRAALAASTPTYATWDDHDFAGNNTDGSAVGKENSLRAFEEYWANPSYGLPTVPGVFFATSWGDVDVAFLDVRYWRGVEGTMLGSAQEAWFDEWLTTSTAPFKLVIDGSQWSFDGADDSWADYPADRDAMFALIAERAVSGVALLSGDIHRSELREIEGSAYPIPEITSSPLAHDTPGTCHAAVEPELLACLDLANYYITVDVDTIAADPTLTAVIHLEDGTPMFTYEWALSDLTP